jgi:hypothetical protein
MLWSRPPRPIVRPQWRSLNMATFPGAERQGAVPRSRKIPSRVDAIDDKCCLGDGLLSGHLGSGSDGDTSGPLCFPHFLGSPRATGRGFVLFIHVLFPDHKKSVGITICYHWHLLHFVMAGVSNPS